MNELAELQDWYLSQCNGDWEHGFGVTIGTFDNPGWHLEINLRDTALENKPFPTIEKGTGADSIDDDPDWFICRIKDGKFDSVCGPKHLATVLRIFLDWNKAG